MSYYVLLLFWYLEGVALGLDGSDARQLLGVFHHLVVRHHLILIESNEEGENEEYYDERWVMMRDALGCAEMRYSEKAPRGCLINKSRGCVIRHFVSHIERVCYVSLLSLPERSRLVRRRVPPQHR